MVHGRRRQAVRDLRIGLAGAQLAEELGVPLLAQLRPLLSALREGGDDGRPIVAVDPDSETAQAFHRLAAQIATELKPKKIFNRELKVI